MWYVKTTRSGARDVEGNLPPEVWTEGVVCPTLNQFDNTGESRATVIVFHPHRSDGARIQGDTINTLTAFMGTGGLNTPMVATDAVRRLTPIECERLQGFPDNWTEQRHDYKKDRVVEQADSSRYKQMGNAVAVPVVDWIIGRLVEADANDRQA
jgi:site-specific DNA-cytosine methylase